ncbi:MAG: hypothetical protein ACI9QN_002533, partial [Arcticibacterium sp.]
SPPSLAMLTAAVFRPTDVGLKVILTVVVT